MNGDIIFAELSGDDENLKEGIEICVPDVCTCEDGTKRDSPLPAMPGGFVRDKIERKVCVRGHGNA